MTEELHVGDKAPEFSLPDQDGNKVSLKSFRGRQVLLYFYPKDDTPGCTKEACGFRDSFERFKKAGVVVLGVSLDDRASHEKFIGKYGLPFSLLSDEDGRISNTYGVYKLKNMYGKKYWGIERTTFVIDQTGRIKAVFKKVKVDGHVDEVLAAL
jgi:peroxiredoxin Q/BCP